MVCDRGRLNDVDFSGVPALAMRFTFIVLVDGGRRWKGRSPNPNAPNPGRTRRRRCIVSSERRHVGEDDVLRSTWLGVFCSMGEG